MSLVSDDMGMPDRIVVTLIHGTWATHSQWTQADSKLRGAIEQTFPGLVEFKPPFQWSAKNGIDARRDAVTRLRDALAHDQPVAGTHHFLIAHSHGGNIALCALRDPNIRTGIAGVACLATPFLIAKPREMGTLAENIIVGGLLAWSVLVAIVFTRLLGMSDLIMSAVTTILTIFLIQRFVVLRARAEAVAGEMQLASPAPERLWIGRIAGDEAAAGLQTGQLVAWFVAWVLRVFVRTYSWAEDMGAGSLGASIRRVTIGIAIMIAVWGLGNWLHVSDGPPLLLWSFITAVSVGLLIVAWGLASQLPRIVVPYAAIVLPALAAGLSILLVLPFGFARAVYGFLLQVDTEQTPLGTWTVHQYSSKKKTTETSQLTGTPLAHSEVYDHPDVLKDLTHWMKECAALEQPNASEAGTGQ